MYVYSSARHINIYAILTNSLRRTATKMYLFICPSIVIAFELHFIAMLLLLFHLFRHFSPLHTYNISAAFGVVVLIGIALLMPSFADAIESNHFGCDSSEYA